MDRSFAGQKMQGLESLEKREYVKKKLPSILGSGKLK